MNKQDLLDELALYLKPPGQGVYAVSAGKEALAAFTQNYLGPSWTPERSWRQHLEGVLSLEGSDAVALLAVPSDVGAGMIRGANRGPEAIRKALGQAPVFDLGDVFIVPQLLDDEMLSPAQKERTQAQMYPELTPEQRSHVPVSPIPMTIRVYQLLKQLNPQLRILLMGGDHTVSWPAVHALLDEDPANNQKTGILHFDAHTDLSKERLGIRYCFATWAYHANEQLGRGQRLLQIGIRVSGKDQQHWEDTCDVKQIWAEEALSLTPEALAERVIAHFTQLGVTHLYISNDLDATDPKWASACGTPEANGLTREHVLVTLAALKYSPFTIIGADIVELAPVLSLSQEASQTSIETATQYLQAELALF